MSLYCLELQCIWKNVCIFSLVGSVRQKFYPEDGNCRELGGGWAVVRSRAVHRASLRSKF